MNLLIGIFQVFGVQFQLATVRAVILKNTSFFQKTFNGCISCFFCSMIQKIIIRELTKLEATYFLHGRCYYLHIYSQLGTIKISEIKFKHTVLYRLANRYQRVVLNGQVSKWAAVNAGVPQGSILGPLLFLIYINDLLTGLSSNSRLFADDTSLFLVVRDMTSSANILNNDLSKINNWACPWKISFNADPSKQAQEVIFSRKIKKPSHL